MSRFFIDRPIFAWVIAIVLMLAGVIAIFSLPVAQFPTIAPLQPLDSENPFAEEAVRVYEDKDKEKDKDRDDKLSPKVSPKTSPTQSASNSPREREEGASPREQKPAPVSPRSGAISTLRMGGRGQRKGTKERKGDVK